MLSSNINYKVVANKIIIIKNNKNIFYKVKNILINRISNIKKSEYLYTFILGDNDYINKDVIESYRKNGISHLFSISGMHITLITSFLLLILNKIKKTNINYIFVFMFLLFFMFLTSFSASVIRATFLFILVFINNLLKLNLSKFRLILYLLLICLLINPYNIYNTGFVFSYSISIYLILFNKIINRHKNYFIKSLITSSIAFIASIPILINNYFSINLLTIINNIIFVPFISIIIFPFSIITLIIPKLDFIFKIIINILEYLSIFISKYSFEIILKKINLIIFIFYNFLIMFILYKILLKKYKYILIFPIIIIFHTNINLLQKNQIISFIDVKQGDSSLIVLPHNKCNVLIDTGGIYNYNLYNNIINYLKSKGIKKLDYLIISHGDFDHMGEAINLVNNFKVDNVIFNCGEYNDLEQDLIKVLDKKKIKYYSCIKELNIDKYKLKFLNTKEYNNENDNSNVIYFNYEGNKFLFMGDAGVEKEKDILDKYNLKTIDFIKVGHHGSNTSSSEYFIDKINPKYSFISVGKNNRYGHPKEEVLDTLKNSKIYRTDLDGSIEIKINKNGYKIRTCPP